MKPLLTRALLFMLLSIGTNMIAMEQETTKLTTTNTPAYDLSEIHEYFRDEFEKEIKGGYMDPGVIPAIVERQRLHQITGCHAHRKDHKNDVWQEEKHFVTFRDGGEIVFYQLSSGTVTKAFTTIMPTQAKSTTSSSDKFN